MRDLHKYFLYPGYLCLFLCIKNKTNPGKIFNDIQTMNINTIIMLIFKLDMIFKGSVSGG